MANLTPDNLLNAIKESSAANTAQSQAFAREQMRFNAEQAQIARDWQEEMSSTAHQREVKDLIAAGLNPVLSAGGSGASTPSGAVAQGASGKVDTGFVQALAGYGTQLINSANQLRIAELQTQASLKAASIAASATLSAAQQSAAAARYSADIYTGSQQYIAKNYPNTLYGTINAALGGTDNFVSNLFKGVSSALSNLSGAFNPSGSRKSSLSDNRHT